MTVSRSLGTAKSPNVLSASSMDTPDGPAKRQLDAASVEDKGIVQAYA